MNSLIEIVLLLVVLPAAVFDLRYRRIPNWVSVSGVLAGLVIHSIPSMGGGTLFALKGLGLALLIYFPLYAIRAMGAGDVKLMGAVGSLVGAGNWLVLFALSVWLQAIIGIILLISKGRLRKTLFNLGFMLQQLAYLRVPYSREELDVTQSKAMRLPHGVAIALGSGVFLILRRVIETG